MYHGATFVIVLLCISAAVAFPRADRGNFPEIEEERERGNFPETEERERGNFPETDERERDNFPSERNELRGYEKPVQHTMDDTDKEPETSSKVQMSDKLKDAATVQWNNDWDGPIFRVCPNGQAFYRVKSTHDNHYEDRLWEWYCRSYAQLTTTCYWSGWINWWDAELNFECSHNYLMSGAYSVHDNYREDRLWDFRCCKLSSGSQTSSCYTTGYINDFDGWMDYSAPSGTAFIGMNSYHSNHHEDRRWKVRRCYV